MAKIKKSVFDAGPFIHLSEISRFNLLVQFSKILTTREILEECKEIESVIRKLKNVEQHGLEPESKNFAKILMGKFDLDLGEAAGISLCKQENIKFFFTDDLEAKDVVNDMGFEAHGSIAIILRAHREKLLNKKEVKIIIEDLYNNSTLFFTKDLFDWTMKEIGKFNKSVKP